MRHYCLPDLNKRKYKFKTYFAVLFSDPDFSLSILSIPLKRYKPLYNIQWEVTVSPIFDLGLSSFYDGKNGKIYMIFLTQFSTFHKTKTHIPLDAVSRWLPNANEIHTSNMQS